ncbi:hypothetical protein AF70_00002050 [Pseudomonas sp. KD5]|nr:hypothetical protein [Pseudomonas sp. KD5]
MCLSSRFDLNPSLWFRGDWSAGIFQMRHQSFLQFQQRISQSSVLARVVRARLEFFDVPKQGFAVVLVEIKNNHVEPGDLEEGVASAGVSVAEFFKLSLYEFVSCFTVSRLQPRAFNSPRHRLGEPEIGLRFVAKNNLGMALDQFCCC